MATPAVTANRIALGALLVAVLALAWTAVGTEVMSALRDPTGAITAPADGTTIVGPNVGVDGTAARTPLTEEVWLVVRPLPDSPWYPVTQVHIQLDGSWQVQPDAVRLDSPGQYRIYLFEATDEAAASFRAYLAGTAGQNGTSGMAVLPPGARVLDSKVVTRQQ
jgi:hypothetical protein